MTAVFLDVDGVLNSTGSVFVKLGPDLDGISPEPDWATYAEYGVKYALRCVNPISVALVNRLLLATGGELVLSSSHRAYLTRGVQQGSEEHLKRLRKYLMLMGLNVPARFSITPTLHVPRGYEIQAWCELHGEPERYVILDDGADFLSHQPLVRCDANRGFDFSDYTIACRTLGIQEPSNILL